VPTVLVVERRLYVVVERRRRQKGLRLRQRLAIAWACGCQWRSVVMVNGRYGPATGSGGEICFGWR
jgi:hypothetical protein